MTSRKRLTLPLALAAIATLALFATSANAQLHIYEPFDYQATNGINNGAYLGDGNQAGGIGLGTWQQVDNNGNDGVGPLPSALAPVNESDVRNGGLSFTDNFANVLPVAGNAWERTQRVGQTATYSPVTASATAGLTADNSTMWMTFLFQDLGFSGPDFGIGLASEKMVGNDSQSLVGAGDGVGLGITSTGGQDRNIHTSVYDNSANFTRVDEATPTFNGPGASGIHLLAMKVNWNEFGTPDEIFVFDLTNNDILIEPSEAAALASDTFDFTLARQQSLDIFNISDTQVSNIDEIRFASSYLEAVGAAAAVPEPASIAIWSILGLGLAGFGYYRERRKK